MISHKEIEEYLLSMPNSKLDYPFGEEVAVYKAFVPSKSAVSSHVERLQGADEQRTEAYMAYGEEAAESATQKSPTSTSRVSGSAGKQDSAVRGDWKMFALVAEKSDPVRISLKCNPKLAEILREKYETVMPGYHLNKQHWNTVLLTGQIGWDEVQGLIRHSYELVTAK